MIADCPDHRPEDDGYLVLVAPGDVDRVLDDLDVPYRLSEVPFESVTVVDECFHAVYLANNQFVLGFLIPDTEQIAGELRRHLEPHGTVDIQIRTDYKYHIAPICTQLAGRFINTR